MSPWNCAGCGVQNAQGHRSCYACGFRPSGVGVVERWIIMRRTCVVCTCDNKFGHMSTCHHCVTGRWTSGYGKGDGKAAAWTCGHCRCMPNYLKTSKCAGAALPGLAIRRRLCRMGPVPVRGACRGRAGNRRPQRSTSTWAALRARRKLPVHRWLCSSRRDGRWAGPTLAPLYAAELAKVAAAAAECGFLTAGADGLAVSRSFIN